MENLLGIRVCERFQHYMFLKHLHKRRCSSLMLMSSEDVLKTIQAGKRSLRWGIVFNLLAFLCLFVLPVTMAVTQGKPKDYFWFGLTMILALIGLVVFLILSLYKSLSGVLRITKKLKYGGWSRLGFALMQITPFLQIVSYFVFKRSVEYVLNVENKTFTQSFDQESYNNIVLISDGQRFVLISILINLVLYSIRISVFGIQRMPDSSDLVSVLMTGSILLTGVLSIIGIEKMAKGMGFNSATKSLCYIISFIPVFSIGMLIRINTQATKILRQYGLRVSAFGVAKTDVLALEKNITTSAVN
jgi:hypothetical protein